METHSSNSSSTHVNRPDLAAQHALAVPGGAHARRPSQASRHSSIAGAESDSSSSSQVTTLSRSRPGMYDRAGPMASSSSLASVKNGTLQTSQEPTVRRPSPGVINTDIARQNRAKHHSQGFFEPTLSSASPTMSNAPSYALTPSQIAAQAAMHGPNPNNHLRKRSQTIPELGPAVTGKRKPSSPSPVPPIPPMYSHVPDNHSGSVSSGATNGQHLGVNSQGATTAANAAFPRSGGGPSPTNPQEETFRAPSPAVTEKEAKTGKEKSSRMKLFSKPKHINIGREKDSDKKSLSSPKKGGGVGNLGQLQHNQSTVSLAESTMSGVSSLYTLSNGSSSTLTPSDRVATGEKEKHRHHFLHRSKKKDHDLTLSSAASNSRPVDPSAPQSIYSFAPASPGPKSMFDLRHAGRNRDKKKEDKTVAFNLGPSTNAGAGLGVGLDSGIRERDQSFSNLTEYSSNTVPGPFGLSSAGSTYSTDFPLGANIQGTAPDDAWPLFKARILNIFEGEDIKIPIEDFNKLIIVHLQRCIQRRAPNLILDDITELFRTGFGSLDHTLRQVPDDRLVPHLVDMWLFVFGTILPFMQAVFLPLDLELRGHGSLLSQREAADFWGDLSGSLTPGSSRPATAVTSSSSSTTTTIRDRAQSNAPSGSSRPGSAPNTTLSTRTLLLTAFRDVVILPRHTTLLTIFSRLSLDNINAAPLDMADVPRPGTAASSSNASGYGLVDPATASYNSQSSTILESSTASSSFGARSRATSNTSAGSFTSLNSRRNVARQRSDSRSALESHAALQPTLVAGARAETAAQGSAKVTQTAARTLQCVSVLAGLQGVYTSTRPQKPLPPVQPQLQQDSLGNSSTLSGIDESSSPEQAARQKMARLAQELKLNWLARGRTGRNRRGFIGSKARNLDIGGNNSGAGTMGGATGLGSVFSLGEGTGVAA